MQVLYSPFFPELSEFYTILPIISMTTPIITQRGTFTNVSLTEFCHKIQQKCHIFGALWGRHMYYMI